MLLIELIEREVQTLRNPQQISVQLKINAGLKVWADETEFSTTLDLPPNPRIF